MGAPRHGRRRVGSLVPDSSCQIRLSDPANWQLCYEQNNATRVDPGLEPDRAQRALLAIER